ncbi:MAG TPA: phosphoglycolate phosphatase [Steroidobacteraceae bacterium]|nr:phosphoglycolate phosphatase [Steroidobacteraceae bacterium]
MLRPPSLMVFDLDGTLVDSLGDLERALNLTLAEFRCGPLTPLRIRGMVGDGVGQLVARALEATGCAADPQEAVARYLAHYEADPVARTTVYPGVRATLEAFREEGIPLAVLTNKLSRSTGLVLERLDLARYFSRVVSGDSLAFRKPDPRVLLALLAEFAVSPAASLMVGDSEVDADTARAAGVPFVQMTYGYHRGPLQEIPSAAQLADFAALGAFIAGRAPP